MSIDNIKQLMDDFDLAALLPDLSNLGAAAMWLTRWATLLGPLVLLALGLYYFLAGPKEANHLAGYRCYYGMGSLEAWRFTQKLAGAVWGGLGLMMTAMMAVQISQLAKMELMDAMLQAIRFIFCQAVATGVSVLAINITVMLRYDRKGRRRASWRSLLGME